MKRFLSILLALVMVLSLVACGNKTTPDTPDTPDKQEETIHIGIVTGSVSQSEDDRRGALRQGERHPRDLSRQLHRRA